MNRWRLGMKTQSIGKAITAASLSVAVIETF